MIDSITIASTATFGDAPQVMRGLSQFNYIFGANGVGKTTISRVIFDQSAHAGCNITWKDGRPLQSLVYNRDFVQKHFHELTDLPGIFTLGEDNTDVLKKIDAEKASLHELETKLTSLRGVLDGSDGISGKRAELFRIEGRKQLDSLHQAWRSGDRATATRAAHTLKSSSAALGALRLSELCRQIEHALRADATDAIDARIDDASRAFAAALAAMDEALAGKERRDD